MEKQLSPVYLEIVNESYKHSVPEGTESHFKVLVISAVFEGHSTLQRQQLVYKILSQEMKEKIHALSQKTLTPKEWDSQKERLDFQTPDCMHQPK